MEAVVLSEDLRTLWNLLVVQLKAEKHLGPEEQLGLLIFNEGDPNVIATLEAQVASLIAERNAALDKITELEAAVARAGPTADYAEKAQATLTAIDKVPRPEEMKP